eukprot:2729881-Amphidinium_carterae.1
MSCVRTLVGQNGKIVWGGVLNCGLPGGAAAPEGEDMLSRQPRNLGPCLHLYKKVRKLYWT